MSWEYPARFGFDGATVTVFKVAELSMTLEEVFGPDPGVSRYFDRPLTESETLPNHSFLVSAGGARVVVDPGEFTRLAAPGHFNAPPGYAPPPPLVEQLRAAGVEPGEVTHVVVTHLHYDHYDGITLPGPPAPVLAFPNAKCVVPRRDWEMPDIAEARSKEDPDVTETLGVAEKAGVLELIDAPTPLGGGITVEPFPGESPGHQILALRTGGGSCYLVGDLYHAPEEVEHPELAASWTDREALIASRNRFAAMASQESALVLPGHMLPGKIAVAGGRAAWRELPRP